MGNCQYAGFIYNINYKTLKGMSFMIVYTKLWETMKACGISQYKLLHEYHVSAGQLDRLRKNGNVNTYTLNTLCNILNCKLEDIAEYIPDQEENKEIS